MAGRDRRRQRFDDVIVYLSDKLQFVAQTRQAKACRTSEWIDDDNSDH